MTEADIPINPISKEPQNERAFYLQSKDGREFIDDYVHKECVVITTVQATSWRFAKELIFGP